VVCFIINTFLLLSALQDRPSTEYLCGGPPETTRQSHCIICKVCGANHASFYPLYFPIRFILCLLLELPKLARIGPTEPWRLALASRCGGDGPILRKAIPPAIIKTSVGQVANSFHALRCASLIITYVSVLVSCSQCCYCPIHSDCCSICRCHPRNGRQHICLCPKRSAGRIARTQSHPAATSMRRSTRQFFFGSTRMRTSLRSHFTSHQRQGLLPGPFFLHSLTVFSFAAQMCPRQPPNRSSRPVIG